MTAPNAGVDNHLRWNGQPGHYEVYYLTLNDRPSATGFWIRYTLEAPLSGHGVPYAELWFGFFDAKDPSENFALRSRQPIATLVETHDPWGLALGSARLTQGTVVGALKSAAHTATWDLSFTSSTGTLRHLPDSLYLSPIAQTKVLSPNPQAFFSGRISVDGRTIELAAEPGCQSHLWGRKHAHAWGWAHCNAFREDPTALVEVLTARLKRGPVVLPAITLLQVRASALDYDGRSLWQLPLSYGRWETGRYCFGARLPTLRIAGAFRCRLEDMIRADYSDPDGEASYCHNSEVAESHLTIWRRHGFGWREACRLTALHSGHFETAGRARDPHVRSAFEQAV